MDEKLDHTLRKIVAQIEANRFVINWLLTQNFIEMGEQLAGKFAQLMKDATEHTQQFEGVARDDFHAEWIADTVLLTQDAAKAMIDRALSTATKARTTGN